MLPSGRTCTLAVRSACFRAFDASRWPPPCCEAQNSRSRFIRLSITTRKSDLGVPSGLFQERMARTERLKRDATDRAAPSTTLR